MPRRVLLASLSLLLVALSACSTKSASTEDASTDTTVEASTATTQPSTDDTATGDTGTDTTAEAPPAAPAASRAGSCPTQDEIDAVQSNVESASDSSDELVAQFDAAYTFLGSYLPDELQPDLALVKSSFASYMQALADVDLSNPEALTDEQTAALNAASETFDTPEVEAANTRIEDYFTQTCPDVNFDEPDSSTTDTTPN